ncbi:MAG: ATPase [Bacteroidetes bacterium]|nr:MAG: ATPase [Bacteroidota bacterium]
MQKILLTGPESSGKSTLAKSLAAEHRCPWVPEFARSFLKALERPYTEDDLLAILLGQCDAEEAAMRAHPSAPYLFCDTGPEVLYIWSMWKYGRVALAIEAAVRNRPYQRRLLCCPDLPWSADPLRENPDQQERLRIFRAYETLFQQYHLDYDVVRGERADFSL